MQTRLDEEKKRQQMSATLESEKKRKQELEAKLHALKFDTLVTKEKLAGDTSDLEATIARLELKQHRISKLFEDLRNSEKVDICFLVDSTGSMSRVINETKTVIHRIVDRLGKRFKDLALRCAFVGYRDIDEGSDRVCVFQFSKNAEAFKDFVGSVKAFGGADECEDVFGGLEQVNQLEWANMSRVLFHVADAPCHGRRFHCTPSDSFPDGDPRGLSIKKLLGDLTARNVEYYFAEVNKSTSKMIDEFNKELQLLNGTQIKQLALASADDLLASVSVSITATIMNSKSLSMHTMERGKEAKKLTVDRSTLLDWSTSRFEKHTANLFVALFCGSVTSLKTDKVEFVRKSVEIWISPRPFAKGSLRYAFAALVNIGTRERPRLVKKVVKESQFADPAMNTFKYYQDIIECQVVASFLANEFNKCAPTSAKPISFLDASLITLDVSGKHYSVEDYMEGTFSKWMNNAGLIDDELYNNTLTAFAHWSYQVSDEYLIVTDLQGFLDKSRGDERYLLTDPAITCLDDFDRFSSTNLGKEGLKFFFKGHQCNPICQSLCLKKHKYQELPDKTAF